MWASARQKSRAQYVRGMRRSVICVINNVSQDASVTNSSPELQLVRGRHHNEQN